jgi:uncharacterized membrane protein
MVDPGNAQAASPVRSALGAVTSKQEAQRRADRIRTFRLECEALLREGVLELPDAQRRRLNEYLDRTLSDLAARFDIDVSDAQKQFSLGMLVTATLGGLAFCAALVMFFYRYWGSLTPVQQSALLVTAPLLLLVATHWSSTRDRSGYYTGLLGLVACAAFGLNLSALGGIFSLVPTPRAFLGWGAFAFAVAYAYGLRLPLAGGLASLAVFAAGTLTELAGGYWAACAERPENFALVGAVLAAVPLVMRQRQPGFASVYRSLGLLLLFVSFEVLMHSGRRSYLPFTDGTTSSIYQAVAFVSAGLVLWLGIRSRFAEVVNIASAFFALFLFDRLFEWWWNWMPRYLFFLILGTIAVLLLLVFRRLRTRTAGREGA